MICVLAVKWLVAKCKDLLKHVCKTPLQNGSCHLMGGFQFYIYNYFSHEIIHASLVLHSINVTQTPFHSYTVIPCIFLDVWKFKICTLLAFHTFPAPICAVDSETNLWATGHLQRHKLWNKPFLIMLADYFYASWNKRELVTSNAVDEQLINKLNNHDL